MSSTRLETSRPQKRQRLSLGILSSCTCCDWVTKHRVFWDHSEYNANFSYGYHCFCCYWSQGNRRKNCRQPFPVFAADVLQASHKGKDLGVSNLQPLHALEAAKLLRFRRPHGAGSTLEKCSFCKPPRGAKLLQD